MTTEERENIENKKKLHDKEAEEEQEAKEQENEVKDSTAVDKYKELKQELAKYKKGENQNIGTFELLTKKVFVQKLNDSIVIDSVDIEIKDGFYKKFQGVCRI